MTQQSKCLSARNNTFINKPTLTLAGTLITFSFSPFYTKIIIILFFINPNVSQIQRFCLQLILMVSVDITVYKYNDLELLSITTATSSKQTTDFNVN